MKYKIIKILVKIFVFLSLFLLTTITIVKGATESYAGHPPNMYDWDASFFSSIHGAKIGGYDAWGNPSTATIYDKISYYDFDVEPSVGFAYYLANKFQNFNSEEMQKIIWASGQWNNESNMLDSYQGDTTQNANSLNARRSYQYGTVYYEILKEAIDNNKNLFKIVSEDDAVKVFVDQDTRKYTIGPYSLVLNTEYSDESAAFLYNEIIGNNNGQTEDTSFASFKGITGLNGDNENAIFLDKDGIQIKFPNFVSGEAFYIRFAPNNDGAISNTGKPVINVDYLQKFKANEVIKYNPIGVQFGGTAGEFETRTGEINSVGYNNDEYKLDKVADRDISSQYSTDTYGKDIPLPMDVHSTSGIVTPTPWPELNELLDDNVNTLPGESSIDAENREYFQNNAEKFTDDVEILLGAVAILYCAPEFGITVGADVAAETGMAVTGTELVSNFLKSFIVDVAWQQGSWLITTAAGKQYNLNDEQKAMVEEARNTGLNLRFLKGIIQEPKLTTLFIDMVWDYVGMNRTDYSPIVIGRSIQVLYEQGVISKREYDYATRILLLYGDESTTYGDWISAYRNGYKLPLSLILQAYGGNSVNSGAGIINKEVVSIEHDDIEKINEDGKKVIDEKRKKYHDAKLTGETYITAKIPVDFGDGFTTRPIRVKVEGELGEVRNL